ncbi:hypothetical protein GFS24_20640 [Chitinophaga sp. SYP-B3965]|uniref:hypothetical protein n=1 Tax=Chitinophaga sp. SYP-B3965 TaxID=2663120 RepID=UPI001299BC1E|nr:hypothetical protein [Chitinophaga sp. SYP-B3965]MRG47542.1 hypothetical protein [Chitinophaga sp. SYP-B3965]
MKKQMFVWFSALLFAFSSCERIPGNQPPKDINITITDIVGKPVEDVHAGMLIKLVSPEFTELNKQGLIRQEGKIFFDKQEAKIKEAKGDYVLLTLPILNYIELTRIDLSLLVRNTRWQLCVACLLYRPTVTGVVLTGGPEDGTFNLPAEMTLDAAGNIYVIDQRTGHDLIKKVTPAGVASNFAGMADEFGRLVGIAIDNTRGLLYVADATSDQVKAINLASPSSITILAGSGTAGNADGTGTAASFRFGANLVSDFGTSEVGQGMTIDASGNLYVGEAYTETISFASQLRKITPAGVVTLVPGSRIEPMSQEQVAMSAGVSIDAGNNIHYVSGSSGFYQGITKITSAGISSRLAGRTSFEGLNDGTGNLAQFSYPKAITSYGANFYVADGTNGALRRVSSTGTVITLAGVGHFATAAYCACPFVGPVSGSYVMPSLLAPADAYETLAAAIRMNQAGGVAVRSAGLIYVADYGYRCIWKITIG